MAVTSIWRVKGWLGKVVIYIEDPDKTENPAFVEKRDMTESQTQGLSDVIGYAVQQNKTSRKQSDSEDGGTLRQFVSGVNCHPATARAEMMAVKKRFGKENGTVAYHGYQSFAPGEATPELAHEIGVRLARELWGEKYQVLVATHLDRESHLHNHFVLNTVSFMDGIKYHRTERDYRNMQQASDRLCREYGLSVIEYPKGKSKSYTEWQAERDGKPTQRSIIRADIDRAILASTTERDFIRIMTDMGYEFKTRGKDGSPLKYPALKPPDAKGFFRFHKLGEGYALEQVKDRILQNIRKQVPFPEAEQKPVRCYRVHNRPRPQITGLRALYFRYCYELHIIVKKPASVKRMSFLLREDIAKLDRLDRETLFLGKNRIETIGELTSHREKASAEIESLTAQRQELRKELRRLMRSNDPSADEVKAEIAQLSGELRKLRKEVSLCDSIAQRSERVRGNLNRLTEQKNLERKELTQDELFRRRGGTGREAVPGGR